MSGSCLFDAQVVSLAGSTAEVVQRRLARVSEAVNERYAAVLDRPWRLLEEGRLQAQARFDLAPAGPLDASARVVEMLCELTLRLTPVRSRILLSPQALTDVGRKRALQQGRRQGLFLLAQGFGPGRDEVLTGGFAGLGGQLWDWTERQAQFVRAILRAGVVTMAPGEAELHFLPGRKRREVAAAFGVSPSVVTECLQAAGIDAFRYSVWSAASLLSGLVASSAASASASRRASAGPKDRHPLGLSSQAT